MKKDICHTSLNILMQNITPVLTSTLEKNNITTDLNIWYPDFELKNPIINNLVSTSVTDCVLTGNFLKRLLEIDSWRKTNYRFWILSERTKDVMVNLLNFDNSEVQIIPRNKIFNYSEKNIKIDKNKNINFIFAGRLSPTKNIESIILTTNYLQNNYNFDCQLHLIGPTDSIQHPDRGASEYSDYIEGLIDLCASLTWRLPVIFHGEMQSTAWPQLNLSNKVLVNHSTFICEDFNVSLAQAQTLGWPSIISSYGGNTDIKRNNSIIFPWNMVGRSDEKIEIKKIKSKILADYIYSKVNILYSETVESSLSNNFTELPKSISFQKLKLINNDLLINLDIAEKSNIPTDLVSLVQNKKGVKFFSKYRLSFGQIDFDDSIAFILNDFYVEQLLSIVQTKEGILILLNKFKGKKIFFISILELNFPENVIILANSKVVCVPFSNLIFDQHFTFIKDIVSSNCKIIMLDNL